MKLHVNYLFSVTELWINSWGISYSFPFLCISSSTFALLFLFTLLLSSMWSHQSSLYLLAPLCYEYCWSFCWTQISFCYRVTLICCECVFLKPQSEPGLMAFIFFSSSAFSGSAHSQKEEEMTESQVNFKYCIFSLSYSTV